MTNTPVLKYFDNKRPDVLTIDASQTWLGHAITQDRRQMAFLSRSLSEAERHHAPIERKKDTSSIPPLIIWKKIHIFLTQQGE